MTSRFNIGDRVRVKTENPGGSNRTPFFIRGKKGVVFFSHGPAPNPTALSHGVNGASEIPLYGVSFHMAHLYDDDPDFVLDRVIVDAWEDWLEPVTQEKIEGMPINREEHELSYHERRVAAVQGLLVQKGLLNLDESRRMVAEFDFRKRGKPHPMATPP